MTMDEASIDATAAKIAALSQAVTGLNDNIDEVLSRRTEVTAMAGEIDDLEQYGKRNRRLIRWLAVSVVLDVCLSVGLGAVALKATDASNQAKTATSTAKVNANNAHQTCLSSNEARVGNLRLWTKVLGFTPPPNETADQRKRRIEFKQFVDELFAPRDCDVVAPAP